ncbi:YkgJ family cysteine cluster protein [Chloracidobacterium validum]|uniref:YkgJ family cysteine cluster protein n=1 Tax=Chloracidobacterium validum TaxID=2821543 RepID=A0ABX8B8E3_9BACT|nr:YkgJ family cysteine cluster protein [Chloracidobacterium validum]QUW03153.1 YkgJ family cysteine cluster protein [Chloracidobacterium validum]
MSERPTPEAARAAYDQLLADIERFAATLRSRFPTAITCRLGCTGCCQQHLTILPIEAARLREHVAALDAPTQARLREQAQATRHREADLASTVTPNGTLTFPPDPERNVPCPALVNEACAVYPARPVLCRTHGFPLLYLDETTEDGGLLDVCPLNFTDGEAEISHRDVFDMTIVNLRLVAASLAFEPDGERQSIADVILSATPAP